MQTLRPSRVPEYLRVSSFYLGLNAADDDEFSIPSNHMKLNMNVNNLTEMTELLNTIRFWGLEIIPQSIVNFAARQRYSVVESTLEPYRADLSFLSKVCSIVAKTVGNEVRLEKAMESGDIDIVRYFHKKQVPFTARAIALAAGRGALDCLQYALSATTAGHYAHRTSVVVYSEAVRRGRMNVILFLRQRGFCLHRSIYSPFSVEEYVDLPEIAASSGQCDVLKYLYSQGCSLSSAATAAADVGHWDCLEYATRHGARLRGESGWDSSIPLAQRLARAGQLKLFPKALSCDKEIDAHTTLDFAKSENWELFKLCIQYITRPTLNILKFVIEKGLLACLRQLYQNYASKKERGGQNSDWLTSAGGFSISNPGPVDLARLAANTKRWECLRFLITHGCPMQKSLSTVLVQADQLELYHLAVAHGCEVSVQVACKFAKNGNSRLLRHALEHGCERSEEILKAAARHGQLPCLMYAHAQGCPWSAQVTLAAARGGHGECLQYLNEHGCPSIKRKYGTLG